MAVYTPLTHDDVAPLVAAFALGPSFELEPLAAGSVNSNFILRCPQGQFFLRVYEEQGWEGVRYEWRLLQALAEAALPVAKLSAPAGQAAPELELHGKPAGIFDYIEGSELSQSAVRPEHLFLLGQQMGGAHAAMMDFPRRRGRFELRDLAERMARIEAAKRPELRDTLKLLHEESARLSAVEALPLERGIIHGDLFRDNVRWQGGAIVALLDWESASEGFLAYDLIVTALSWCYGDVFEWPNAAALFKGYEGFRPLDEREALALRDLAMFAALRFTITRLTDFYLRPPGTLGLQKDYRRFLERLEIFRALSAEDCALRLLGR